MALEPETQLHTPEMPDEKDSSGIFRYALGIEYRGTAYCGWQRQDDRLELRQHSVQFLVERALSSVAAEKIITICAGRTDSGVHAFEQVVHFETRALRPDKAWILGVNANLPDDISVCWVRAVPDSFHARFSATARTYRYFIDNSHRRPALARQLMTWMRYPLSEDDMHRAAQYLLGENDFSSFRGSSCQSKTPFRFVHHISVRRSGSMVVIEIKANAFLHHMVRNIAGALFMVGTGDKPVTWFESLLQEKSRSSAGITAPANGLYLLTVEYPAHFELPQSKPVALDKVDCFQGMLTGNF